MVAGAVPPVEGGPRTLVDAHRVHLGTVAEVVDALYGRHSGRDGRRLQEKAVADAVSGHGPVDGHRLAQGHPQGEVEQADAGRPLQHLGHTSAHPPVDLDDAGPVGCELDLGVQAAGAHPEGVDGLGGQVEDGRAAPGVEGGGNEEPGLTEVFGRREAPGQRQVADGAVGDHALDRHVAGVRVAVPGRIVRQITLDDHVGAARAEGDEQVLEFGTVAGQEGVAAALGRAGLEDGGPPHLGLDCQELARGLVGADEVAGGHVQAGRGEGPTLAGLVGERRGSRLAVERQDQILCHAGKFDHTGV